MSVGHLAAGFKAAGSITLNWQQQGTYVDNLPHVLGLAARRWSDNEKNEPHFQTPPMAPQKKGCHVCGPFGGRFQSCWLNHTQLAFCTEMSRIHNDLITFSHADSSVPGSLELHGSPLSVCQSRTATLSSSAS